MNDIIIDSINNKYKEYELSLEIEEFTALLNVYTIIPNNATVLNTEVELLSYIYDITKEDIIKISKVSLESIFIIMLKIIVKVVLAFILVVFIGGAVNSSAAGGGSEDIVYIRNKHIVVKDVVDRINLNDNLIKKFGKEQMVSIALAGFIGNNKPKVASYTISSIYAVFKIIKDVKGEGILNMLEYVMFRPFLNEMSIKFKLYDALYNNIKLWEYIVFETKPPTFKDYITNAIIIKESALQLRYTTDNALFNVKEIKKIIMENYDDVNDVISQLNYAQGKFEQLQDKSDVYVVYDKEIKRFKKSLSNRFKIDPDDTDFKFLIKEFFIKYMKGIDRIKSFISMLLTKTNLFHTTMSIGFDYVDDDMNTLYKRIVDYYTSASKDPNSFKAIKEVLNDKIVTEAFNALNKTKPK